MSSSMDWFRKPAVSGRFYPGEEKALRESLSTYCKTRESSAVTEVFGIIVPHAGYIYSGGIAGEAYRRIVVPDRVIILCPNHTGLGDRISVWSQGTWETPLGEVEVDSSLASALLSDLNRKGDSSAHLHEHAIEVQIPFLQFKNKNVRIVPIVLGHLSIQQCLDLAERLARVINTEEFHGTLLIASTDMSHYISSAAAKNQDELALQEIRNLDPRRLYRVVGEEQISMCGYIPTTCVMKAALDLGCTKTEIVAYGNSGERTGDFQSVVGYASCLLL